MSVLKNTWRHVEALVYDVVVVVGVALIAAGLWLASPTLALIWVGSSLILAVRYGRA